MNELWGISGPAFAWLYGICVVLPFTLAGLHALWLRRGFDDGGRLPSVHCVAALAGGTARVTETVVAAMLEREQARLGRSGRLYRTPLGSGGGSPPSPTPRFWGSGQSGGSPTSAQGS